jgi:hypothetical protein
MGTEVGIHLPEPHPEQLGANLLRRTAPQGTDHHHLPEPQPEQLGAIQSKAKRKVVRAGRRSGKTVGIAIYAVEQFLAGWRILYAAPTSEQISRFWARLTISIKH